MADKISVYAPCAMGQVVTAANVDTFKFPIICGSANNQLESDDLADRLNANGVLYCPDFLVNAGGVIAAANEVVGFDAMELENTIYGMAEVLTDIVHLAERLKTTPLRIAIALADMRLK